MNHFDPFSTRERIIIGMGSFGAPYPNDEFIDVVIELFNDRAMTVMERLESTEVESSHTSVSGGTGKNATKHRGSRPTWGLGGLIMVGCGVLYGR